MINIAQEFDAVLFCGDLDEPYILTKSAGQVITGLTGIFSWQSTNSDVQNVSISNTKKLTLLVSVGQLSAKNVTIDKTDTITLRNVQYSMLSAPSDNLDGTLTLQY